jgi:hypothetical protein
MGRVRYNDFLHAYFRRKAREYYWKKKKKAQSQPSLGDKGNSPPDG